MFYSKKPHTCDPSHDSTCCISCQRCEACAEDISRRAFLSESLGLIALAVSIASVSFLLTALFGS